MIATAVTAYVPLPEHETVRSEQEYRTLLGKLAALPIPLMICEGQLEDCWLYEFITSRNEPVSFSVADNPKKNSLAYHVVQAQKSQWLVEAAMFNPIPDVFVWIDCGILHLAGLQGEMIVNFMQRVESEQSIAIPGCWDSNYEYSDDWPCWRFCGGVIVVPRKYVAAFDVAMKREYVRKILESGRVTWDVNMLSRVEVNEPRLPIWHYKADHDASIFTNYQPTGAVVN